MTDLVTTDWRGAGMAPPAGLVQQLEPRLRIVLGAALALVTVALDRLPLLIVALALAGLLAALARLPALVTLKRMAGMDAFMVPILLILPFTVPGQVLATVGALEISAEGLHQAAAIVLTANAVVMALLALVGTIEPAILGHSLLRLGVPGKIVSLLLFTVRYIALLQQEYRRLRLAMKARAFRPAGNRHTWRSLGYLVGMLLVRSFERSERILAAMKCRGFVGRYVMPDQPSPRAADCGFGLVFGAILLALLVAETLG